jgi:HK97 family phage portal protein
MAKLISLNLESPERRYDPLENPSTSLAAPASWLYDALAEGSMTLSGIRVNEGNALTEPTTYACIKVLCESVGSLPIYVYEREDKGRRLADETPLYGLLSLEPNPEMGPMAFVEALMMGILKFGNGYAEIERNGGGQPVALWPLSSAKTSPTRVNNVLMYQTTVGQTGDQTEGLRPRLIKAENMLHVPALAADGILGISPIKQLKKTIGLAMACERFGETFFGNTGMPSGTLETPNKYDDKSKALLRSTWMKGNSGENGNSIAILDNALKFNPVRIQNDQAQFIETRKTLQLLVCQGFRVPPHMLGIMGGSTKANIEQQALEFVTQTLRPYLVRFEQEFQRKLFPTLGRNAGKYFAEFHLDAILRGDQVSRQQANALGRQWGYLSINDARFREGLPSIGPTGDGFQVPLNMIDVANLQKGLDEPPATQVQLDEEDTDEIEQDGDAVSSAGAARFAKQYGKLLTDCYSRLLNHRDKRTYEVIYRTLSPVLDMIVTDSATYGCTSLRSKPVEVNPDATLRDYYKGLEKRGFDSVDDEIRKVLRFILINTHREIAAQKIITELDEVAA